MMLDEYCGSQFWNSSASWDTPTPHLSPCFQHTTLVWVPCLFLWLWSSYHVCTAKSSTARQIPWNALNIAKFGLTGLLITLQATVLVVLLTTTATTEQLLDERHRLAVHSLCLKLATFVLSLYLDALSKRHGLRTSGIQFLFWLLLVACQVLILSAEAGALESGVWGSWWIIVDIVYTVLISLQLFLNCWADAEPVYSSGGTTGGRPCPESGSSFPSRLCFFWFEGLARLGHRRPLEFEDLWELAPENASKSINPPFIAYWDQKAQKSPSGAGANPELVNRNQVQANASFKRKNSSVDIDVKYKPDLSDGNGYGVPPDPEIPTNPSSASAGNIVAILCHQFGGTFLFGSLLKLLQDLLAFASPFILRRLIQHTAKVADSADAYPWQGYAYAVGLLFVGIVGSLVGNQYFYRMYVIGLRVRTAVVGCVYRKALRLPVSGAGVCPGVGGGNEPSTSGEIVNLMSVDVQKLTDMCPYLTIVWSAPLQIGLSLYFLYDLLGASVFAGLGVMILLLPVSAIMGIKVKAYQSRQLKSKDRRMRLLHEILGGIRVLKLYAWEPAFELQVTAIRNAEIRVLKESAFVSAIAMFVWTCAPVLVAIVTFTVFVLAGGELNAERAFVSLAYFNIMRIPLNLLPMMLVSIVQSSVSIRRLNSYLNLEEVEDVDHDHDVEAPIRIQNASFSWKRGKDPSTSTLRDIDFTAREEELVAVVGPVGSGKSSLLAAMLGEIEKVHVDVEDAGLPVVSTRGSIAYVSQVPWIQNTTVRDNILFGRPFEAGRYAQVLEACALGPDLEILPGGDVTEIGEKGINLSGGQKQRVALARAVYHNADVYLLDDPLSAVDAHVGKHIFERVLGSKGLLGGKTRVLVTHGVSFLPQVDRIVVLSEGIITEQGSYRELLDRKGVFAEFLVQYLSSAAADDAGAILSDLETTLGQKKEELIRSIPKSILTETPVIENGNISHHKEDKGDCKEAEATAAPARLIEDEGMEEGVVKWGVFFYYLQSIGWRLVVAAVLFQLVFQAFSVGSNIWLAIWSDSNSVIEGPGPAPSNGTLNVTMTSRGEYGYLCGYASFGVGQALSIFVATLAMSIGTLSASGLLHTKILHRIMRAPMAFFDTTPQGRIVNRLGKDIEVLDNAVSMSLTSWLKCLFNVVATMGVVTFTTPGFILVVIPTAVLYLAAQRFYIASSRQLRRLESVTRSPIYSHFAETLQGVATVRAFGAKAVEAFVSRSEAIVDQNQMCAFASIVSARFLAVLLETVGNLVIFFAALFAVAYGPGLTSGLVGLSLSYVLQITHALNWLVETTNNVENNLVAVERLKEYSEISQEAPWTLESGDSDTEPPLQLLTAWPDAGTVSFESYATRYRDELDLVLQELTFDVAPGEKVGVCGRTGAGKSSLALALFRLLEPAQGRIEIDGVDISRLGLHQLRRSLTVIPQDPFVFAGTIRSNLDPFGLYSDDDLHRALGLAHLRRFVQERAGGLDHKVTEGGSNLSVGQRQLICLARALLRKSRILVLDEATAAIDLETDDLIQETIRREFSECTILTIAHRLNTILDYTRILVLEAGAVREFDTPKRLLEDKESVFYSLAKDAGIVS